MNFFLKTRENSQAPGLGKGIEHFDLGRGIWAWFMKKVKSTITCIKGFDNHTYQLPSPRFPTLACPFAPVVGHFSGVPWPNKRPTCAWRVDFAGAQIVNPEGVDFRKKFLTFSSCAKPEGVQVLPFPALCRGGNAQIQWGLGRGGVNEENFS